MLSVCTLLMQRLLCENNIVLSFLNLISLPQIDTWPWIMHKKAFLPNDWTMFYLKWEQKAPRPWQGCFGWNQTLVFCAVAETEALMRCVGQMVGAGEAHWPLCAAAAAGCPAQAADPARLQRTHRVWPGGCKEMLAQSSRACRCNTCGIYTRRLINRQHKRLHRNSVLG